jgi:TorA maturation chaperone TorD
MKVNDQLCREAARRDSFKLISACYHPPSRDLIPTLRELQDRLRQICAEAVQPVRRMKEQLETIEDFDGLLIDYSRLFLGPYELLAPPYGSVYLDVGRRVMGDSTVDTRNRYRDAGLDISKDFCEAPDHIAAELEFMYFLIFKEIQALSNFDSELAIDYLKKQKSFLEQHLTAWVAEFSDNIEKNAQTEFYRNLGRCTSLFVLNDHRHLKKSFGGAISLHSASCEESKRNVI